MIRKLLILFVLGSFFSCSDSATQKEQPIAGTTYPALPESIRKDLLEKCDYIDITFYNYPISTSQDAVSSIRPALTYWDPAPATVPNICKPAAHIWYQSKGNNLLEADIYFASSCFIYVFYENGKPTYANPMNGTGQAFFDRILRSFIQQK